MERHPCSQIERINIIKIFMLPKVIYIFNAILITILASCYIEGENKLQIHMEEKGSWKAKRILLKETEAGGLILSGFQNILQTAVFKTV